MADEVHLLDYLIVLAKHSRLIIFVSAAVTILVYLNLFISPNQYKATARLLPPTLNLTLSGQILEALGGVEVLLQPAGLWGVWGVLLPL